MKVTNEKVENSQVFITVEMEPVEVEEALDRSYRRLVHKAKIPGFRKGKAPRDILERHIGRDGLLDDALNIMVPEAYNKAVAEQKLEPFAQPNIEVTQNDPLIFKATVPLPPIVKIGDYNKIRITQKHITLNERDVDATLEQLQHQNAVWKPVERSVEYNDLLVLDIDGTIEDISFISRKGSSYQVISDSSFPAPGFAEQLIGMRRDEVKEFKLQLPVDYSKSELAGKESIFKVVVTEIKQEELPELNDEFAKGVNPDFTTIKALREQIKNNIKLRMEEKARADFEEQLVDAVINIAEIEFPPVLVEIEINHLIDQQLQRWKMAGKGLEDYLRSIKKNEEELRSELRPIANKRVSWSLVLDEIAEKEKIEVNDSEVDTEIENIIQNAGENKERLQKVFAISESCESIKRSLITRKTIQRLNEIASSSHETTNKTKKGRNK